MPSRRCTPPLRLAAVAGVLALLSGAGCPKTVDTGATDEDGDGWNMASDCDDTDAAVNPDAPEICDEADNDCDGEVDEAVLLTFFSDVDGDGYGFSGRTAEGCTAPSGYVEDTTDCDDERSDVWPGAPEACDEADNDCDGEVDEGALLTLYQDADGDGHGVDDMVIEGCEAGNGFALTADDCNDRDASAWPGATEYCDGLDNDCDGVVDDDTVNGLTFYEDADGDGYGNPASTFVDCTAPSGWTEDASDCDDAAAWVSPAAVEVCDGIDNDCDGVTDPGDSADAVLFYEDADGDGYGNPASTTTLCSVVPGWTDDQTDCDDATSYVYPGRNCFVPAYIWWDFNFGVLSGAMANVSKDGATVRPTMVLNLATEDYAAAFDPAYLCAVTFEIKSIAGTLDSAAWHDWAVLGPAYKSDTGGLCDDINTALYGTDPFDTIATLFDIEITVEDLSRVLELMLEVAYGADWATYERYVYGGDLYLDGARVDQVYYGIGWEVDSGGRVTGDPLTTNEVSTGRDAYIELVSAYIFEF